MLPPGIHLAAVGEGQGAVRAAHQRRAELIAKLGEFLVLVRSFDVFTMIFVDGSFVTDKADPGDIDVVLVLPRANIPRLLQHPSAAQIVDSSRIKQIYEVDLFIQPSPHGMVDFFQLLRPDEAIRRGVPPDMSRGILEVAL